MSFPCDSGESTGLEEKDLQFRKMILAGWMEKVGGQRRKGWSGGCYSAVVHVRKTGMRQRARASRWWQEAAWGSRNAEATCDREAPTEEAGKTVVLVAVPRAQEERTCV